mmetsp:Transcript_34454/g.97896  ORF Transcript_34454/g.97896 Transcript_34454/m.97896 type:complete len:202 (-) Transcript_34454:1048-1653(-)
MWAFNSSSFIFFLNASMINSEASVPPTEARAMRGVTPSVSCMVTSAPNSRRSLVASFWPLVAASKRAVPPLECLSSRLAFPSSTKILMTSVRSDAAAYISADTSLMPVGLSTAQPAWRRYLTASAFPCAAAITRGLKPLAGIWFTYSGSSAFSTNIFKIATSPFSAALISGVVPSLSWTLGSTPFSSNSATASSCPPTLAV